MAYSYEQTFEDLNLGALNGQDGWTSDSRFTVINSDADNGDKSLNCALSSDNFVYATKSLNESSGVVYISFKFSVTNGTTNGDIDLYDSSGANLLRVFFNGTHLQRLDSGGWTNIVSNASADTWYRIGIEWDSTNQPNKFRVNVDDGAWSSWVNTWLSRTFSNITTIRLGARNESGVGSVKFDSISPNYTIAEPEQEPEPASPTSTCDDNCAISIGMGF